MAAERIAIMALARGPQGNVCSWQVRQPFPYVVDVKACDPHAGPYPTRISMTLLEWLRGAKPDVVCLQELKTTDAEIGIEIGRAPL
jgi:hypothetical protein